MVFTYFSICSTLKFLLGVTTNSSSGVVDYETFYPVFAQMEKSDMILNLHGESPSTAGSGITVMNAEPKFLPTFLSLHQKFPQLRIILEHCTSAAAVEAVKQCGSTVAATITAHHLFLTIDDVVADPFCFCKPGKIFKSSLANNDFNMEQLQRAHKIAMNFYAQ